MISPQTKLRPKLCACQTVQYFAASSKVPSHSVEAETAVRDFVENTDNTVLAAICTAADSRTIRFVAAVPADCDCLLFYKIPQICPGGGGDAAAEVASDATVDGTQLGMLTLIGGLVQSMYSSVTRVYAPHVTQVVQAVGIVFSVVFSITVLRRDPSTRLSWRTFSKACTHRSGRRWGSPSLVRIDLVSKPRNCLNAP